MRVLHLITGLGVGGAETQLLLLATHMKNKKHDLLVISLTDGGYNYERLKKADINVQSLETGKGVRLIKNIFYLNAIIKNWKPDIVQSWLYHADLFALFGTKIFHKIPLVWNIRCSELKLSDHSRALFFIIKILSYLSRLPNAVVANSQPGKVFHQKIGYKPERWKIIPNAIDTEYFHPSGNARESIRNELGVRDDAKLVGLVARYHPMKDHAGFIKAVSLLSKDIENTYFVIVGPGNDATNTKLIKDIENHGLSENFYLLGSRTDIDCLQAAWDIAVLSSYSEGFPNVLGEAMSCAVPCISTDVGEAKNLIGDSGYIVPPRDYTALSKSMGRMLSLTTEQRVSLGKQARKRIIDNFSIPTIMDQYIDLYSNLTK